MFSQVHLLGSLLDGCGKPLYSDFSVSLFPSTSPSALVPLGCWPTPQLCPPSVAIAWRVENVTPWRGVMASRKIFSKFFSFDACKLRIGVYESSDSCLCMYLESDGQSAETDENFWVRHPPCSASALRFPRQAHLPLRPSKNQPFER